MTHPSARDRFAALFGQHHCQVYAYAVSRAGRDLADDIVSGTFLVAWRRLDAVPADPLPWLLGVARNVVLQWHRDAARQLSLLTLAPAPAAVEGDVAVAVAERAATLTALDALGAADRELLTLVGWHGLAAREAAQVVGCATATFLVRLHRARERFEHALADQSAVVAPSRSAEEVRR
ncbi:RNA polymerase sigma factor [Plantactinospora solaniradicis]|uniref:RNA polymerase sigma factor n=1 Tax=Plantactinospora solaniradicis TaxID=1723736 RepID=A0ABW1K9G5_9ACTN